MTDASQDLVTGRRGYSLLRLARLIKKTIPTYSQETRTESLGSALARLEDTAPHLLEDIGFVPDHRQGSDPGLRICEGDDGDCVEWQMRAIASGAPVASIR